MTGGLSFWDAVAGFPQACCEAVPEDVASLDIINKRDEGNQQKHGVSFALAQYAFADSQRIIAEDVNHSKSEMRYYCFGKVGDGILTVRFTYRNNVIRIIGAGYWRKGKAIYEHENKIHR